MSDRKNGGEHNSQTINGNTSEKKRVRVLSFIGRFVHKLKTRVKKKKCTKLNWWKISFSYSLWNFLICTRIHAQAPTQQQRFSLACFDVFPFLFGFSGTLAQRLRVKFKFNIQCCLLHSIYFNSEVLSFFSLSLSFQQQIFPFVISTPQSCSFYPAQFFPFCLFYLLNRTSARHRHQINIDSHLMMNIKHTPSPNHFCGWIRWITCLKMSTL